MPAWREVAREDLHNGPEAKRKLAMRFARAKSIVGFHHASIWIINTPTLGVKYFVSL
jgi:hypothetical protein